MEMLIILAVIVVLFPYIAVVMLFARTNKMNQTFNARLTQLQIELGRLQFLLGNAKPHTSEPSSSEDPANPHVTKTKTTATTDKNLADDDDIGDAPPWSPTIAYTPSLPVRSKESIPLITAKSVPILEPDEQSTHVVTSIWHTVLAWFQGGNAIVRIGVIVLMIGVVLLLRFASAHLSVPIEVRLGLVALGGVALTMLGMRLAAKSIAISNVAVIPTQDVDVLRDSVVAALSRRGYALSLMGAGLAILYLTLFAAFRLYHLVPNTLTFALLAILAVITALLALKQDAFPLAFMAFAGAFLAPILTSDGSNNVIGLFSYYLLLNVAIAWLAHFRTWKVLNLLGAFFTFGLAGFWGWHQYQINAWSVEGAALRWPLEGLLIIHLALYLFIVVRYSQQLVKLQQSTTDDKAEPFPLVDGSLLFGVPVLGFGLQAGLLHDLPYALAISSAVLAGVYLLLGRYLLKQGGAMRLLTEGTLAVGLGFLALVLPLALNAQWTSAGWAVQGAGLVWLGQRQQRGWQLVFGLGLQVISCGVLAWVAFDDHSANLTVGLGVLAAAILVSAALLRSRDAGVVLHHQLIVSIGALSLGLIVTALWIDDVLSYIAYLRDGHELLSRTLNVFLLIVLGLGLDRLLLWMEIRTTTRMLLPLAAILLLSMTGSVWYLPLGLIWVVLGVVQLMRLAQTTSEQALQISARTPHASARVDQTVWVVSILLFAAFAFDVLSKINALLPALLILAAMRLKHIPSWINREQLLHDLALPILTVMGLWVWTVNLVADGLLFGLPYVPLINGLDITLALLGFVALRLKTYVPVSLSKYVLAAVAIAGFWSITGMVVRSLHAWTGSPLWPDAWDVDTVQSSLTIVWALLALVATWLASQRAWREVWLAGIALLVLVVAKLLFVDLSHVGAMARIVSFICAGLIMLLIGYIAPLPPAKIEPRTDQDQGGESKTTHQDNPHD